MSFNNMIGTVEIGATAVGRTGIDCIRLHSAVLASTLTVYVYNVIVM